MAQPSVKQGYVEGVIAYKLFYLGIVPRVRKVEGRGRVAVDAVLPIRIPSAKINRNGIGKRNPCFSICAEIAVGIAFVAAQTFIEVGNAIGTEITRAKACRHRAKYTRNLPDGLCRVAPPIFGDRKSTLLTSSH